LSQRCRRKTTPCPDVLILSFRLVLDEALCLSYSLD
jgi:hypothetical protein